MRQILLLFLAGFAVLFALLLVSIMEKGGF